MDEDEQLRLAMLESERLAKKQKLDEEEMMLQALRESMAAKND